MVKFPLLFLLLSLSFILNAQIQFVKVYSDLGFEKGEGITQLSDSSYLLTGSSTSFGDGPPQAFLMKLDSLGNHKWSKHYGGSEINEGKRVFAIENYGYFIGGNTNSNPNADHNFYFVKTDENGDPLFEKQEGTPAWDFVNDAIMLADSSFILTGETYNSSDGFVDSYTIRFDKNGDTIWTSQSHKPGIDRIYAAANVGDTAFVLAGTVWNQDSLAQKSFLGLYRYDNSVIWEKEYGITGDFEIRDVVLWNDVFHCVGNRILILDSLKDEYVVRVNLLGNPLYTYSYLAWSYKSMNHLVKYGNSSKFYIAIAFIDEYSYGTGEDIFIGRYIDFLNFDYSQTQFSANDQDDLGDFIPTSDGGAIMVGTNRSLGTQNANVFVLKIGPYDLYPNPGLVPIVQSLVEIKEDLLITDNLMIYPNPTSGKFQIKGINTIGKLYFLNSVGQITKIFSLESEGKLIDASELENGIYHLQFTSNEGDRVNLGKFFKY
jgi:hypothetical protein